MRPLGFVAADMPLIDRSYTSYQGCYQAHEKKHSKSGPKKSLTIFSAQIWPAFLFLFPTNIHPTILVNNFLGPDLDLFSLTYSVAPLSTNVAHVNLHLR